VCGVIRGAPGTSLSSQRAGIYNPLTGEIHSRPATNPKYANNWEIANIVLHKIKKPFSKPPSRPSRVHDVSNFFAERQFCAKKYKSFIREETNFKTYILDVLEEHDEQCAWWHMRNARGCTLRQYIRTSSDRECVGVHGRFLSGRPWAIQGRRKMKGGQGGIRRRRRGQGFPLASSACCPFPGASRAGGGRGTSWHRSRGR